MWTGLLYKEYLSFSDNISVLGFILDCLDIKLPTVKKPKTNYILKEVVACQNDSFTHFEPIDKKDALSGWKKSKSSYFAFCSVFDVGSRWVCKNKRRLESHYWKWRGKNNRRNFNRRRCFLLVKDGKGNSIFVMQKK